MLKKDFENLSEVKQYCTIVNHKLSWLKRKDFNKLNVRFKRRVLTFQNLPWFEREDFNKLSEEEQHFALAYQKLSWFKREDFNKLSEEEQYFALAHQNLTWFERKDFNKLSIVLAYHNAGSKEVALAHQNLTWFKREDFNKLSEEEQYFALAHQNLTCLTRKDFEELNDFNKEYAIGRQNLTWFKKKDFEKLSESQKMLVLTFQSLPWFTKKICGTFYLIHKKRTKKQRFKEMTEYADEFNLTFDGENLFAFRQHTKLGLGTFKLNAFYEAGKYYKDWHVNHDEKCENSFGLGIFPSGNTPVKVHIDDWGCRVKDSNKCRVWGFTMAEDYGEVGDSLLDLL